MAPRQPHWPFYRRSKHLSQLSSFDVRPASVTLSAGTLGSTRLQSDKRTTPGSSGSQQPL